MKIDIFRSIRRENKIISEIVKILSDHPLLSRMETWSCEIYVFDLIIVQSI